MGDSNQTLGRRARPSDDTKDEEGDFEMAQSSDVRRHALNRGQMRLVHQRSERRNPLLERPDAIDRGLETTNLPADIKELIRALEGHATRIYADDVSVLQPYLPVEGIRQLVGELVGESRTVYLAQNMRLLARAAAELAIFTVVDAQDNVVIQLETNSYTPLTLFPLRLEYHGKDDMPVVTGYVAFEAGNIRIADFKAGKLYHFETYGGLFRDGAYRDNEHNTVFEQVLALAFGHRREEDVAVETDCYRARLPDGSVSPGRRGTLSDNWKRGEWASCSTTGIEFSGAFRATAQERPGTWDGGLLQLAMNGNGLMELYVDNSDYVRAANLPHGISLAPRAPTEHETALDRDWDVVFPADEDDGCLFVSLRPGRERFGWMRHNEIVLTRHVAAHPFALLRLVRQCAAMPAMMQVRRFLKAPQRA